MISQRHRSHFGALAAVSSLAFGSMVAPAAAAWQPTRTVEFIVPAGTGGGADQMRA